METVNHPYQYKFVCDFDAVKKFRDFKSPRVLELRSDKPAETIIAELSLKEYAKHLSFLYEGHWRRLEELLERKCTLHEYFGRRYVFQPESIILLVFDDSVHHCPVISVSDPLPRFFIEGQTIEFWAERFKNEKRESTPTVLLSFGAFRVKVLEYRNCVTLKKLTNLLLSVKCLIISCLYGRMATKIPY